MALLKLSALALLALRAVSVFAADAVVSEQTMPPTHTLI